MAEFLAASRSHTWANPRLWTMCPWTKCWRCFSDCLSQLYLRFARIIGCSPGSALKKKKGQTSDQCGSHHHTMGGLVYAKTQGLGPTVLTRTVPIIG